MNTAITRPAMNNTRTRPGYKYITFAAEPRDYERIRAAAEDAGMTISDFVRGCLRRRVPGALTIARPRRRYERKPRTEA